MNQKQKTIVETAAQELSVLMGKLPRRYACHFIVDDLSIPSEANKKNCNLTVFSIAQHIGLTTAYVQGSPAETIKNLSAHTNSPACGIAQIGYFNDSSELDSSVLFRFKTDEDFEVILLTLNQELMDKVLFEVSSSDSEVKLTPVKPIFFDFTKKTTVPLVPVDIASLEDLKGNEVLDKISRMKKTKIDIVSDGVPYEGVESVIYNVLRIFGLHATRLECVIGVTGNDHVSYKSQAAIVSDTNYNGLKDKIKAMGFEKIIRVITREDILNGVVPSSKQCIYVADNQMLELVTSVFPLLKEVEKVNRVVEIMKHRRGVLTVKVEPEPCEFTVSEERESMAAASISNKTLSWPDVVKDHKKLLVKSQNENFDLHSIGDLNITASQEHKDMFTNLESIANARQCLGTMNLKANIQSLAEAAKETEELNKPIEATTESTTDSPTPVKEETMNIEKDEHTGLKFITPPNVVEVKIPDNSKPPMKDNSMNHTFEFTVRMPAFTQWLLHARVSKGAYMRVPATTFTGVMDMSEEKMKLLVDILHRHDNDAKATLIELHKTRAMETTGVCDDVGMLKDMFADKLKDSGVLSDCPLDVSGEIKAVKFIVIKSIKETDGVYTFDLVGYRNCPDQNMTGWMEVKEHDVFVKVDELIALLNKQDIERSKESMSSGLEAKKAEDQTDLETLIAETAYRVDGQCKAAINQSLNDIRTYTKAMNLKRDENFITFSNTRKTLVRRCAMIKQRLDADDASLSAVVVVHLVNDLVSLSSQVEKDGAVYKQIDFLVSHIKNSYKFGIENERQAPVLMHTDEYGAVKTLVLLESLLFVIA